MPWVRVEPYSVERAPSPGIPRDDESAQQARRRVVRVPLHPGRDLQQRIALEGQVATGERRGRGGTGDGGGGRAAEAARVRDRVAAAQVQAGRRVAEDVQGAAHRPDDEVRARRGAPGRRPRPSTSTVSPSAATATSISSYRPSASPSVSNPGPRLADDAGTRTRTSVGLPTAPTVAGGGRAALLNPTQEGTMLDGAAIRRARSAWGSPRHRSSSASATAPGSIGTTVGVGRGEQRGVGVLQPVPVTVHTTSDPRGSVAVRRRLQQPRDARRRRRLDEHRLARRQQPVRREDLVVGHRREPPARLVTRRDRLRPRRGSPDPDRGRDRLRVAHRRAVHQRRRACGLETEHPRQARRSRRPSRTPGSPPSRR